MSGNKKLTYQLPNGGKLQLGAHIVYQLTTFKQQTSLMPESGGILLGRLIHNTPHIVVDTITTPQVGDHQSRLQFIRNAPRHQEIINQYWQQSNGTCNFLGEWHTHPQRVPTPSGIDLRSWAQTLRQDTFYTRYLYFLIVGIDEIAVWQGSYQSEEFTKLSMLT